MTELAQLLHTELHRAFSHDDCDASIKSIKGMVERTCLFEFAVETENEEILQEQIWKFDVQFLGKIMLPKTIKPII